MWNEDKVNGRLIKCGRKLSDLPLTYRVYLYSFHIQFDASKKEKS